MNYYSKQVEKRERIKDTTLVVGIDLDVRLIGDKAQLTGKVPESKIIHAPNIIKMDESPQLAFKKKDSSIGVGIRLQKEGKIDAFVGAGNTGAYVMFNSFLLGRIKGIRRMVGQIRKP